MVHWFGCFWMVLAGLGGFERSWLAQVVLGGSS